MFGPREREILIQSLCQLYELHPAAIDRAPCKLGMACDNRHACEALAQRTLEFMRDLRARPVAQATAA